MSHVATVELCEKRSQRVMSRWPVRSPLDSSNFDTEMVLGEIGEFVRCMFGAARTTRQRPSGSDTTGISVM